MSRLAPDIKPEIDTLRRMVKDANPKLSERIKWNAPSFHYKQDIVTIGPYKPGKILLVFHHPAVVQIKSELLEGDYRDRRLVYFKNSFDAKSHKKEIVRIINEIVKFLENK